MCTGPLEFYGQDIWEKHGGRGKLYQDLHQSNFITESYNFTGFYNDTEIEDPDCQSGAGN